MSVIQFIIYYIGTLITALVYLKCYSKMSKIDLEFNIKIYLIIVITSIVMLINNNYNISSYRIIISFIITYFFFSLIFKENFLQTAINTIIFFIICCIIEVILSIFLFYSIDNMYLFNENIYFKFGFSILETVIIYFFISLKSINEIILKIKKTIKKFINFYSFTLILILLLNVLAYLRSSDLKNYNYIIIIIFAIIFIIFTTKEIINSKYNNNILKEKNNNLKNSFKAYADTIEDCKILKHNLKNDLLALSTTIPNKYKIEINYLINKYNNGFEWLNRIDEIPEGLQGLIYLKINEAKAKKINIELNISENIKPDKKDYIELTEIIGILIDNAIEASTKTKNKIVVIDIFQNPNYLCMKIINNYKNNININKIGNKNYSTKEIKSGLGLNFIKKIKNNKIKVEFKIINDLFITEIYYKQKIN